MTIARLATLVPLCSGFVTTLTAGRTPKHTAADFASLCNINLDTVGEPDRTTVQGAEVVADAATLNAEKTQEVIESPEECKQFSAAAKEVRRMAREVIFGERADEAMAREERHRENH
ncbi:hypothetical protein ERJ75_000781200 [Trypanosoma vivax]|nr:hypothetical protein ERJ75_000781200 [Trypanosoma vivax]